MKRCDDCRRRIWPWQSWSGWGPAGFRLRSADHAEHAACMRRRALEQHRPPHERTSICNLIDCPNQTAAEDS